MARRAGGYRIFERGGIAWVDVWIRGQRFRSSLVVDASRTQEAATLAARRYKEILDGRITAPEGRIRTALTLDEIVTKWAEHRAHERPRSERMHDDHARAFLRIFRDVRALFADSAREDYATERAKTALRKTIRKELSSLARLYEWAKREGLITSIPPAYSMPLHLHGTRTGRQRAESVSLTPAEVAKLIAALPVVTPKGLRARDFFSLLWETGLRESTLARLSVPEHWRPGQRHLQITRDIDKSSFSRDVPLTPRAVAALKRSAGTRVGLIFGDHDWRKIYRAAALQALGDKGPLFATRALRHARATDLVHAAGLTGPAHLLGHKQVTTTNTYTHPTYGMAAAALEKGTNKGTGRGHNSK